MKPDLKKDAALEAYKKSFTEKEHALAVNAKRESESTLEKVKKAVKDLIEKYPYITKAIVFGSLAGGKMGAASDIDLYLEPVKSKDFWNIKAVLENILNKDVDLLIPSDDEYIIKRAHETGEVVYERED
jgi:predicted nucleotidyltransferase